MKTLFRDAYLLSEWIKTNRAFGLGPNFREFEFLRKSHGGSGRHYHSFEHIAECIRFANTHYGDQPTLPIVKWALFYHDVIYDVKSKTNEEDSAARFEVFALSRINGEKLTPSMVFLSSALIRSTASHRAESASISTAMMIDTDLHILGAERSRYLRYARDVWLEYSSVGEDAYRQGRLAFLNSINPFDLFHTDAGRALIPQVIGNITMEMALLESRDPNFLTL